MRRNFARCLLFVVPVLLIACSSLSELPPPTSPATTAAPTAVVATPPPPPTATAVPPTRAATPKPLIAPTVVPATPVAREPPLDDTLILYTAVMQATNANHATPEPHWAFKSWPTLAALDSDAFATLYGKTANAADNPGMLFFDYGPQLAPDGRHLLIPGITGSPDGSVPGTGLWLFELTTGAARQLLPRTQVATWNPAGDAIAYVDEGTLYTLAIAEGATPQPLFQHHDLWGIYAKWSPDGRWIAAVAGVQQWPAEESQPNLTFTYWLVPPDGGAALELARYEAFAAGYSAGEVSWSPDGQFLLAHNRVYDLAGNQLMSSNTARLGWLPDRPQLLQQSEGLHIVTVDGQTVATITTQFASGRAFSNDGTRLAYTQRAGEGEPDTLWVYDLEQGESWLVSAAAGNPIRWSADDSHLIMSVSRDHRLQIVTVSAEPGGAEQLLIEDGLLIEAVPYPLP